MGNYPSFFSQHNVPTLRRAVLVLGLLLFFSGGWSGGRLFCENVIYHTYSSQSRDKELEEILYLSSGVALESAGYSSTRDINKGDIVLTTSYTLTEGEITALFTLSSPGIVDDVLAHAERSFALDYELDSVIDGAINELLAKADFSTPGAKASSIDGLFKEQFFPVSAGERGLFDGAELSASVIPGGDLFLGEITSLMRYSYTGTTRLDIIIPKSGPRMFIGLYLSGSGALKNGDIVGGTLFITRAGPSLGISLGNLGPVMFSVSISSGASILSVYSEGERLDKTVPYAGASGTAYVRVWDDYFLLFETGLSSIFDQDLSFYTVTAGIGIRREF